MKRYEVLIDGVSVWKSEMGYHQTAINPKLKLQYNKTDEFRITLLPGNPEYDAVSRFKSTVEILEDTTVIFVGRIRSISTTLKGNKSLTCEGAFAFFLDSYLEPYDSTTTVSLYFESLIEHHNSQLETGRVFEYLGCSNETNATKDRFILEDINTTQNSITALLNRQRATLHFVYGPDSIGVELLEGMTPVMGNQSLEVGSNIIDMNNEDDEDVFSSIMPIGDNGIMLTPKVIDIPGATELYGGRILSIQRFPVATVADLQKMADKFIEVQSFLFPSKFTVTAVDLSIIDVTVDKLQLGNTYTILHAKQQLTVERKLTCIDFDMMKPHQSTYTFEDGDSIWDVTDIGESPGGYGWNGRYADIGSAGVSDDGKAKDGAAKASKTKTTKTSSGSAASAEHGLYVMYDKQRNLDISARNLNIKFDKLDAYAKATDGRVTQVTANVDGLSTKVTGIDGKVGQLQVQSDRIELSVGDKADKKAIIELINSGEGGQVKIQADKIALDGDTIVHWLEGKQVAVNNISADMADITSITGTSVQGETVFGEAVGCTTLNGETCAVCSFLVDGVSKGSFFGPGDISISLSDLPGYDDAIKAARIEGANSVTMSSAGWVNGVNTVTAKSPYIADKTFPVNLPPITVSGGSAWTTDHKTTITVSTPSVGVPIAQKEIDASSVHNAAWRDALDTVRLDPSTTTKMEFGTDIEVKAIGTDRFGFSETLATVTIQAPDPDEAYEQGAKDLWNSLNYSSASWSDGPQPAPGWQNTTVTISSRFGSKQWSHQVRIP